MEPDDFDDLTPLLTALQNDRYVVRRQAHEALGQLHGAAAVPALLAGLAIPDRRVRATIATLLGELRDRRAVLPLIDLLQTGEASDDFANVRARAAEALGHLGDTQAVEPLMVALADEDAETRTNAIEALGRLGDRRAVEPLIAATRATRNPRGATILGNFGDQRAVVPLLAELEPLRLEAEPGHAMDRWQAIYYYYVIRALGKLGDPQAVPLLQWIRDHEREPLLKRRSLGDVAAIALRRIAERTEPAQEGARHIDS
jgi:HEAT repeat protein